MKKSNVNKLQKILDNLEEYKDTLSEVLEAEQEIFDNKSEKWQESDKGEHAQNALYELEKALTSLESFYDELTNATDTYE